MGVKRRVGVGGSVQRSILICSNLKKIFGRGNFIPLKLKTEDFVYLQRGRRGVKYPRNER